MKKSLNHSNLTLGLQKKNLGATMIEALVALFIFSIGALGLAALQLTSLMSSGESQQRSVVIWKAQEFTDRIRANKSIVADYVTKVGNSSLDNIGKDTADGVISCGSTPGFVKPSSICSDVVGTPSASCETPADAVAYDVWDVFCNPNGGLATVAGSDSDDFAESGTAGVVNLEVVLRQNSIADGDPDDDVMLVLEWFSREAEANTDIAKTKTVDADICDIPDLKIASSLNVYCVRFSLN